MQGDACSAIEKSVRFYSYHRHRSVCLNICSQGLYWVPQVYDLQIISRARKLRICIYQTFFTILYRGFVYLFCKYICQLCGSYILWVLRCHVPLGFSEHICFQNTFENPPRSLPRQWNTWGFPVWSQELQGTIKHKCSCPWIRLCKCLGLGTRQCWAFKSHICPIFIEQVASPVASPGRAKGCKSCCKSLEGWRVWSTVLNKGPGNPLRPGLSPCHLHPHKACVREGHDGYRWQSGGET